VSLLLVTNFIVTSVLRQQSCYRKCDREFPRNLPRIYDKITLRFLKMSIIEILSEAVHISHHILNSLMYIILGCFEHRATGLHDARRKSTVNMILQYTNRLGGVLYCIKSAPIKGSWSKEQAYLHAEV